MLERTSDASLPERQFLLDEELRRREVAIREREMTVRENEASIAVAVTPPGISASQATVAAAILALVSGLAGALILAWSTQRLETGKSLTSLELKEREVQGNLDLEKAKQEANQKLERNKFETSLILEAIRTPARADAIRNLKFFVKAGFIADERGKIEQLTDDSLPSIGEPSALGPSGADRDPGHLHPALRQKVASLMQRLKQEGLTFEILDGFRSPTQQLAFYAQGRVDDSQLVSNAKPWSVLHNFGLAVDIVQIREKSAYFGPDLTGYRRMHALAEELGLKTVKGVFQDWPHVELPDVTVAELRAGKYPPGGDPSWAVNLSSAIANWTRTVAAIRAWGAEIPETPPPPPLR